MAKRSKTAEKKPVAKSEALETAVITQIFKVNQPTYLKVRTLAAARRGTGKAATAQDIYVEAINDYLERHALELKGEAKRA